MTKSGCVGDENILLVPLPPAIMTPLYHNGFPVRNVPSVSRLRAMMLIHYHTCNLKRGIFSHCLLSLHRNAPEDLNRYTYTTKIRSLMIPK